MSVTALSTSPTTWQAAVEGGGGACLCSEVTARNVAAALSRAHTRAPQKLLCALVEAHVPQMLRSVAGTRVLTALVEYGTPRTVDRVAAYVTAADAATWTLQHTSAPPSDDATAATVEQRALVAAHSRLLERFVYREDGTGAAYDALMRALRDTAPARLLASPLTLPAAARRMLVDAAFARQCAADATVTAALQRALCGGDGTADDAAMSLQLRTAAEACCTTLLQHGDEPGTTHTKADTAAKTTTTMTADDETTAMHELLCDFVWRAMAPLMQRDAPARPREALLLSLVTHATPRIVDEAGRCLATWPQLHTLARQRTTFSTIVAVVLERAEDMTVGCALLRCVCASVADIDARLTSRQTALLRVLAAAAARPAYVATVEQTCGGGGKNSSGSSGSSGNKTQTVAAKLHAARVRYTNATTQRSVATAQTVLAKLRALPDAQTSGRRPQQQEQHQQRRGKRSRS